jgi:hypothetical protein
LEISETIQSPHEAKANMCKFTDKNSSATTCKFKEEWYKELKGLNPSPSLIP